MRTPLAWKNLTHDRRRLALALGGIGFAVLLMCMQLSFASALFESTVALIRRFDADLVITNPAKYTIIVRETFKRRLMVRAGECPAVASATPLYIETQLSVVTNASGEGVPIRVLAFAPDDRALKLPEFNEHLVELRQPFNALFDRRSKPSYDVKLPPQGQTLKLADDIVELVGGFTLGTDFANDGNLIVDSATYLKLFPLRASGDDGLDDVDVGLIKVKPGMGSVDDAKRQLQEILPDDEATVFTKEEFARQEGAFWANATPIGYIFGLGTIMGFIVGIVICYQILYADIADHLAEFATLKAMGYPNGYFVGVVLQEAVLLSVLGFVPGLAASELVCSLVADRTGLLVHVTQPIAWEVLGLSVAMCVTSGWMTMRKVMSADPAELFR
ncbi:MAG TPA: ABC transporter permease DevC [Pirellulales bacterium]|nr:ABC transporter permease DevC [Pirellulales bacterium]